MISYPITARPHIERYQIDGPMLVARSGEIHFLTMGERLLLILGRTDAERLERKRFPHLFTGAPT